MLIFCVSYNRWIYEIYGPHGIGLGSMGDQVQSQAAICESKQTDGHMKDQERGDLMYKATKGLSRMMMVT